MSEPTPVRLVDLRETPLDVEEVLAALDDDTSGGLTLFVGRVRDHDQGKGVDRPRLLRAPHRARHDARGLRAGRGGPRRARHRRRAPGRHPGHRRRGRRGRHQLRPPRHVVRRLAAADRHAQGRGADLEAPAVQRRHRGVGRVTLSPP